MNQNIIYKTEDKIANRRKLGAHLTSIDIFSKYILPEIKASLWDYSWIDLFAGEGNLILPMLELIPLKQRVKFFKEHIFLFDVQEPMVEQLVANAEKYGIPNDLAKTNIQKKDTLKDYPKFIKNLKYPPFHITNPPYLYLGYIAKHSARNLKYLEYFKGKNEDKGGIKNEVQRM